MASSLESLLYSAVGTVAIATDKVKELLEDLMQNNAYTRDEGRRIVHTFLRDMEDSRDDLNNRIYVLVDDMLIKLNLPSQDQLQKRVNKIKKEVAIHPLNRAMKKKRSAVAVTRETASNR